MTMTLEQIIANCKEEISDCQIDLDGISELLEEYPERKEAFAHEIDDYKKRMDYNRQLAEWLEELSRARTLLKATHELLETAKKSPYVLETLRIVVHYDEADCDGNCLKEDIECYFDEYGEDGDAE